MRFLSYIESTGTQYIDTGFQPNHNTRLVIDFDVTAASAQCALFGSRTAYASNSYNVFTATNNAGYQDDYGTASKTGSGVTSSGRHVLDKNKNVLYVDGTAFNTSTAQSFTGTYSIYLLSINNGGTALTAYPTTAKIYSCRIYDNDALVRDFVPAENDDGMIGLYDKVNAEFYGNVGTGVFIGGEPLNEMFSVNFTGLTNDQIYYARVYPMNLKGAAQSEIGTQLGSAMPVAGLDLAQLPEGTVVMLGESGVATPFYVAKHDYESGLNGAGRTLLVRKEGYDLRPWGSNNAYASSSIDTWLNGTYKSLLDAEVQQKIGETKFYYIPGNGSTSVGQLSRAVFILSHTELGLSFSYSKSIGTALPIASTIKIAKKNGNPVSQWTRSPRTDNTTSVVAVSDAGAATSGGASGTPQRYSCPCFTLPADTKFSMEPNADGSYTLL